MPRSLDDWRRSEATALPGWIKPQLTRLVDQAPDGPDWLHEIKFDGYRLHARLDRGSVKLLTRTRLDWTHKYPPIAEAVSSLGARQAYLDGELCGIFPDGITSFSMIQAASDAGNAAADRAQGAARRAAVRRCRAARRPELSCNNARPALGSAAPIAEATDRAAAAPPAHRRRARDKRCRRFPLKNCVRAPDERRSDDQMSRRLNGENPHFTKSEQ